MKMETIQKPIHFDASILAQLSDASIGAMCESIHPLYFSEEKTLLVGYKINGKTVSFIIKTCFNKGKDGVTPLISTIITLEGSTDAKKSVACGQQWFGNHPFGRRTEAEVTDLQETVLRALGEDAFKCAKTLTERLKGFPAKNA